MARLEFSVPAFANSVVQCMKSNKNCIELSFYLFFKLIYFPIYVTEKITAVYTHPIVCVAPLCILYVIGTSDFDSSHFDLKSKIFKYNALNATNSTRSKRKSYE